MNRLFAILLTGLLLGYAAPEPWLLARAAELPTHGTERVAASVNQEAITIHDLDARVRLGLLAANLPDTVENRQRLTEDTLRRLIDERLELQEATRLKVEVGDTEIAGGIADLEQQNHLQPAQLIPLLERNGIDPQTMRDQIHAQIAWLRVIREQLLPSIRIGEEEIDARMKQMKEGLNKVAYLAADIYLPVDDPKREEEVRSLAGRLVDQLKAGAPFSALAHQFSRSGGATGGDLGWVARGMIDDQLLDVLSKLEPGHASVPIRTGDGYHVMLLRDKHAAGTGLSDEPTVDIAQIDLVMLPSATDGEREQMIAKFHRAVEKDNACSDYEKHAGSIAIAHYSRVGLMRPSETPADVRPLIDKLKKGEMSEPYKLENTYRFFVACDRAEATNGLPSRDEVRRRMQDERLDLLAVRYLRDLRRAAFVEIRI
jgi:peptidyl-prolyl cis-trans isomerase SurA